VILRKLAGAIRKQDWFTVVLEILIVMIGIYFGLQADTWNQSRLEDQRAQQALEELQVDFTAIDERASDLASYYKGIIDDLQILIRNWKSGEINDEDEAAIKNALAKGDIFGDPPPPSGTYRNLASSGNLALVRDKDLRLRLIEYDHSIDIIFESDAAVTTILGHFGYAFKRYSTMGEFHQIPDSSDLSFVRISLLTVDQVDYEAMLADPDFLVAAELHLNMVIARYGNISGSQSKIRQIRNLIDRNLDMQADSTLDSP
jgi:hypothetical protein